MNKIIQLAHENKIDEAVELIKQLDEKEEEKVLLVLIEILEETNNHLLRNTIAIILSDIGNNIAVEPIIKMLRHPKTLGYRGTLVYSLESLDYSSHLELLVKFVCEGNFEVSRQSLILIDAIKGSLTSEARNKYIQTISSKVDELEEQIEFLQEAINIF